MYYEEDGQYGANEIGEPPTRKLMRHLKQGYAHPSVSPDRYDGTGYSVPGALCLAYRHIRPEFQVDGFPNFKQVQEVLLDLNPELTKCCQLAEHIKYLLLHNDNGNFPKAWKKLEYLLTWSGWFDGKWHTKGLPHGPREPNMLEIHNKRLKLEERGVRLRFLWAMRKTQ